MDNQGVEQTEVVEGQVYDLHCQVPREMQGYGCPKGKVGRPHGLPVALSDDERIKKGRKDDGSFS